MANAIGKEIPEMVGDFVSGFGGKGWKIWKNEGKWTAEFDDLRVRGTMSVHELVVKRIRAVCGALGISQACGKVEEVEEDSVYYYLKMEGDDVSGYGGFRAGDLVRCQRWTSQGVKGYWVEVAGVDGRWLNILKSEFKGVITDETKEVKSEQVLSVKTSDVALTVGGERVSARGSQLTIGGDASFDTMAKPSKGDELVQYGSTKHENRRTAIYLHAAEDEQPAMDILFGIKEKSFDGCLKVRLGGGLPDDGGVGLYCEDGHILAKSESGEVLYEMKPDGSFNMGRGQFVYDPKKDTLTLGSKVVMKWEPPKIESETEYAIGENATSVPSSGWSSTYPSAAEGDYVWTRTRMRYSDGSSSGEYIYMVSRVGKDGMNVDIVGTSVYYAVTKSNIRPSAFPYTSVPALKAGDWLWSKTIVMYSNGSSTVCYASSYVGKDGVDVHRNLMDLTDFSFTEEMYGDVLRFGSDSAQVSSGAEITGKGVHDSDVLSCSGAGDEYVDLFDIVVPFEPSTWYTLSFYHKGGAISNHVYPNVVDTGSPVYADGRLEAAEAYGSRSYEASESWIRHFYTFRTKSSLGTDKHVLLRVPAGGDAVSVCLVTIRKGVRGSVEREGFYSHNSMVEESAKDGASALKSGDMNWSYAELFSENVTGQLSGGSDYTLSFYSRGKGNIHTFVWGGGDASPLDLDFRCIADGVASDKYVEDGDHSWTLGEEWVRHTYVFRTKSVIPSKVYVLFRAYAGGAEICQLKLESGQTASDWGRSENDRTADLPFWVNDWNGHTTEINGEKVVSPQAFFGEKKDGKLTGVLIGARVLEGYSTGLYGLKDGNVMVGIDPVKGLYEFRGTIVGDEGQFNGMLFGSYYKSNVVVTESNYHDLFVERVHYEGGGKITVPDWRRVAQVIVINGLPDSTGDEIEFYLPPYYYNGAKIPNAEDYAMGLSMLGSTLVLLNRTSGEKSSSVRIHGKFLGAGASVSQMKDYVDLGSERCMYMTCKISSGGVVYYEESEFSESSWSPTFPGTVVPLKPSDWRADLKN